MKLNPAYLLVALVLLAADAPPHGGAIEGGVVVVKDGKPVKQDDVYVYLEDVKRPRRRRALPGAGVKREIRQKGVEFVPHVLVVPVGTEVAFPNYDREPHNVFSPTGPGFDLGRYNTDKRGEPYTFLDVDEFDIFCDIHRQMWAKVKVVDSAYIAPVIDGRFTFGNVAPGTYKVVAWTRNSPEVKSDKVVVTSSGTVKLTSDLHLQLATRSGCHDRKDGTSYTKYARCPTE